MGRHDYGSGISIRELLMRVSDETLDQMAAVHAQKVTPWPPSPVPRGVPRAPEVALRTLPYRVAHEVERRAARLVSTLEFARLIRTATSMPGELLRACLAQMARDRMPARKPSWEIPGNYSDRR